jgi:hypothetical protein
VKTKRPIPFEFILDYLFPFVPQIKQMFGSFSLYRGEKILLVLREKEKDPEMNGVWVATKKEHHESLRMELPSLCAIPLLGKGETNWQLIPPDAEDFESSVIHLCELIKKDDKRIGTIPKKRKK